MQQGLLLAVAITMCTLPLSACDDVARSTAPVSLSQVAGGEERLVTMMDGCDPESFGAVDVTCGRRGGVRFERFLRLLGRHHSVGAWRFSPGTLNARVGQTLVAVNHGGEVHTFTEVEEFGGGSVQVLNELSGNPVPAPECQNLAPGALIAPGGSYTDEVEEPGTERYQCCIHPWMRLELHARS